MKIVRHAVDPHTVTTRTARSVATVQYRSHGEGEPAGHFTVEELWEFVSWMRDNFAPEATVQLGVWTTDPFYIARGGDETVVRMAPS